MSTSISQAISGTLELITIGRDIYQAVANAMDSAESVSNATNGKGKKDWVLAYAKSIVLDAGKNWDKWAKHISDFIDAAKSIYNSLKGIF